MDVDNTLKAAERPLYVRVMPDSCGTGIWHADFTPADLTGLPVSHDLITRIAAWQAEYDSLDLYDADDGFDVCAFNVVGQRIANDIKQQLPDWVVEFVALRKTFLSHLA